ncbi:MULTISPECIES: tRNA epoxyqueuosine(34) reductase QueG [Thalassobaculum]|uniref:Epoxyqueuosine reductase n=1 Tax=Thalassobaculum litoreum DSM 18839 TaxID=1123362 RepID=A0A8G2BKL3_9PROT|nr:MULTISPECIES: tRNA epoxyqueuosine(34) reductase QueG [Thalassobaculum]SDF92580.1 epoxyqueuosine reductase [Thalassobaculum litoreum DSM 18839]
MTDAPTLAERIEAKARAAGFDAVGITRAEVGAREQARLDAFVAAGQHGEMAWMADTHDRRRDPKTLWPEARSVVVCAMNYGPEHDPLDDLRRTDRGVIAAYARNRDYHDLVKKRLKRVARWMHAELDCEVKVFVDTAPVLEKPLAASAGVGWQGKHSNLVSREHGSWLFLGEIFTTLDLTPDAAETDHCGSCRRCLDICPTDAFPAPYTLDARRCISYLTIEHKGPVPREFRAAMGNRIYGCDDCLAVCPWNKFAETAREAAFVAREDLTLPLLSELAGLDDAAFRARFSGSPIKRTGRDRFVRNVLIALGNSGTADALPSVASLLDDDSALVRGAAVWAYLRLGGAPGDRPARENDREVLAEWAAGPDERGLRR